MDRSLRKMLSLSPLVKFVLPAAIAALLVLGSAPARAQDTDTAQLSWQATYSGAFAPQLADDGTIISTTISGILPGDATFLPDSMGFFNQFVDPANPTALNGSFALYGGENGTVFGTYVGTQTLPDDSEVMLISGTYTLQDGWMDTFGAATGSGSFSGSVDLFTGQMTITFTGTVLPVTPPTD